MITGKASNQAFSAINLLQQLPNQPELKGFQSTFRSVQQGSTAAVHRGFNSNTPNAATRTDKLKIHA
jgi:hypothetical protein